MTVVRPQMTNFKMTVRADYSAFTCSPLPQPIKLLSTDCSDRRESAFRQVSLSHPKVPGIQNKANFPPACPLEWL